MTFVNQYSFQELKEQVEKQLEHMKIVKDDIQGNVATSSVVKEKLSEAQVLLTRLPNELQNRADYLQTNLNYRIEYGSLREKFFEWAHNAGEKLSSNENGINIDTVHSDLEDHMVIFFSINNNN